MKVIKINPQYPNQAVISKIANLLKKGKLVIFPTETVYGLGADALNPAAVKKIFRVKRRPKNKPLLILIAKNSDLRKVAKNIPKSAFRLMKEFWPGPLTLILEKRKRISKALTGGKENIAVRISSHPVARAIARALNRPITAPSANISGKKPHRRASKLISEFRNIQEIEALVDAGATPIGKPSTILDLTKKPPTILRAGSITKKQIAKLMRLR